MSKYLALDCETGGFEGTSLLSLYCGVYDESFTLLDELELFLRPKDHIYRVTAEALTINKINLIDHETKAIPYNEGGTLLYEFLKKNSANIHIFIPEGVNITDIESHYGAGYLNKVITQNPVIEFPGVIEKLEPLGHNVAFDIIKIKDNLISEGSWLKYVSYRLMDTGGIGNFLKKQGKIPKEISGSLSSYCEYFKVDNSKAHDAKADCQMTVSVYKEMLKL